MDSRCGIHVNPWLIHVSVWQKPLQYCKVISLQLIKINGKKKTKQTEKKDTKNKHTHTQNGLKETDSLVLSLRFNV